jgi:hypothetical protein
LKKVNTGRKSAISVASWKSWQPVWLARVGGIFWIQADSYCRLVNGFKSAVRGQRNAGRGLIYIKNGYAISGFFKRAVFV